MSGVTEVEEVVHSSAPQIPPKIVKKKKKKKNRTRHRCSVWRVDDVKISTTKLNGVLPK